MKCNLNLTWQPGTQIPTPNACVLAYDQRSDSVFTLYHDGDEWCAWTPDPNLDSGVAITGPTCWSYCTSNEYAFTDIPTANVASPDPAFTWVDAVALVEELTDQCAKTIEQRVMKLTEETGEVSRAVLISTDSPGARYRPKPEDGHDEVVEECADVMIVVLSILYHHLGKNYQDYSDQLFAQLQKKLGKWKHILQVERNLNDGNS